MVEIDLSNFDIDVRQNWRTLVGNLASKAMISTFLEPQGSRYHYITVGK